LATKEKAASWGKLYKLPSKLAVSIAADPTTERPSNGQLFLSYLGALYLSNDRGSQVASKWLEGIIRHEEVAGPAEPDSDEESMADDQMYSPPRRPSTVSPPPVVRSPIPPPLRSPVPVMLDDGINALAKLNEVTSQRKEILDWVETSSGPDHARAWSVKVVCE